MSPTEGLFHEGVRLGSGGRTDGREGVGVNDRFGLGDGLARNDGADRFGLTELRGLGLTDGLGRFIDGLGRLKDVLGRLGLIEGLGLGATDLDRLDIRFCRLDLGADWAIGDGPRLICGLGAEPNDRDPIELPRFITDGLDGVCGEACTRGAALLAFIREARLLRPRDWAQTCCPAGSIIPTRTATTNKPETRFLAFRGPATRDCLLSLSANIEILLSPRR